MWLQALSSEPSGHFAKECLRAMRWMVIGPPIENVVTKSQVTEVSVFNDFLVAMGILSGVVAYVHLTEVAANSKHTKCTVERKLLELGAATSARLAARVTHIVVVSSKATATAAEATAELWQLFQKADKARRFPPSPASRSARVSHEVTSSPSLINTCHTLLAPHGVFLITCMRSHRRFARQSTWYLRCGCMRVIRVHAGWQRASSQCGAPSSVSCGSRQPHQDQGQVRSGFSVLHALRWGTCRCKTVGCAASGQKRTPQLVPRRAVEVELDINLFSSSQLIRDGAETEGQLAARK